MQSPLKIMAAGYSLVYKNGSLVRSVADISENDPVTIRFADGSAEAVIVSAKKAKENR